jgi:hypothetical protein
MVIARKVRIAMNIPILPIVLAIVSSFSYNGVKPFSMLSFSSADPA